MSIIEFPASEQLLKHGGSGDFCLTPPFVSTVAPDSVRNHKEMPPPGEASQASGDQATPPPAPGMSNVAIKPPMKLNLRENTSENWKTYKQ